ncbi:cytochrome P450 3A21-like [Argiope bruennichi]|uniref:cytochrome P450 3A21-like n=1 Tax=Argiope bruennichi TaxID=94029 RepID=UPI002494769C|nr:cytochrome P450 3A21-like [Argiope bruennichi]
MPGEELLADSLAITLFFGIISLFCLYWYSIKDFDYWKKRGIPYVKPVLPFIGTSYSLLWKPAHQIDVERYRKLGPVYGQFDGARPVLVIADLKLVREVLVKEFPSFINRRVSSFKNGDSIVDAMLFVLHGDEWKRVRNILTPAFTTGKIKRMIDIIKECGQTATENFRTTAKSGKPFQAKLIYGAFAMDVIASAAFSVKLDSHNDTKNQFVQTAKEAFSTDFGFKLFIFLLFPKLAKLFKVSIISPKPLVFFREVILQIMEKRKKTGQTRNDFLQLLMATLKEDTEELKVDKGIEENSITSNYGHDESTYQTPKFGSNKNLSLNAAVAQSISFFTAGFDTVASTLSFATYLLAVNPEIQERMYEEVHQVLEKTEGELTYEAIQEMKYLDNVLSETLRLYPVIPRLERMTETDCKLGDTGITVPKGMAIVIPSYALHKDPKLFPDPEKFDPDRFLPEERAKRDPYAYLPFGDGPRHCIGMRFALIEVKTCLVYVIANFKILRCPETKVPLEFCLGPGLLIPKDIILKFEERTDKISLK